MNARVEPDIGTRRGWQHVVFYSLLVLLSVEPLAGRFERGEVPVVPLLLIGGLAAWYFFWLARGSTAGGSADTTRLIYIAGVAALWAPLLLVDMSFLPMGLMVFIPHCMERRRFGLAVVALGTGAWLWLQWKTADALTWCDLAAAALIAVSGAAIVQYVSWHARVSAERQRLLDDLRDAQDGRVAAERQAGVIEERHRLARDLHDTLTQNFVSTVMLLEAAEESLPADSAARRHVSLALRSAREGVTESRRAVWALRPGPLDDGGLAAALRGLAERTRDETGIDTEVAVTGEAYELGTARQAALLRVAQEALSNARKHARPDRIDITLSYMEDTVTLDVVDDGIGFDPTAARGDRSGGVGLDAMRERLVAIGAALAVESAPGQGTTVAATLRTAAPSDTPDEVAEARP